MKYRGRIIGIIIVIVFTILIREYAYYKLGITLWNPPIFALIAAFLAYKFGKKYDFYVFIATKDCLTQLYNRHYIIKIFDNVLDKTLQEKNSLGIFIIDCNDFKNINDKYGHIEGDKTLKMLADIFIQDKKSEDIISRWGGDEFLIIKTITSNDQCEKYITSLNNKLHQLSKNSKTKISISAGYYICYKKIKLDDAIAQADKMMYEKKILRKTLTIKSVY